MKISTGKQIELVLIPTIELYRGGFKKEHRHFGGMTYYVTIKWLKYNFTISKEFK